MVERNVCPENRRKIEILITQTGLDILAELDPLIENHENGITNNLTNLELEQLNNLLEKIKHGINIKMNIYMYFLVKFSIKEIILIYNSEK